jgi:hypothetical protein
LKRRLGTAPLLGAKNERLGILAGSSIIILGQEMGALSR